MAIIRDELTIIDKFTSTFNSFIHLGKNAAGSATDLGSAASGASQRTSDLGSAASGASQRTSDLGSAASGASQRTSDLGSAASGASQDLDKVSRSADSAKGSLAEAGSSGVKGFESLAGKLVAINQGLELIKKGASALFGPLKSVLEMGGTRAVGIEQAQASLKGLGHEAAAVQAITQNATDAVTDTAFSLDQAMGVASSAVAAGVAPGQDLVDTLTLVGDAATIANTDMQRMGSIFNKVAANGKLTGQELNQLGDAGIPIIQLLGKTMGKTGEEVRKMVSDGKVGFAEFQEAMKDGLGGAAKASGETFTGALSNVRAALGRLGASAMQPIMASLTPVLGEIKEVINGVTKSVAPMMAEFAEQIPGILQSIMPAIQQLGDAFVRLIPQILPVLTTIMEMIAQFLPAIIEVVVPIIESVLQLMTALSPLVDVIGEIFAALTPLIDSFFVLLSALVPLIEMIAGVSAVLAPLITQFIDELIPVLIMLIDMVAQVMGILAPWIEQMAGQLLPIIMQLIPPLMNLAQQVFPILMQAIQYVMTALDILAPIIENIINLFTAVYDVLAPVLMPILEKLVHIAGILLVSAMLAVDLIITTIVSIFYYLEAAVWAVVAAFEALIPGGEDGAASLQKASDAAAKGTQAWVDYADAVNQANEAMQAIQNGDPPTTAYKGTGGDSGFGSTGGGGNNYQKTKDLPEMPKLDLGLGGGGGAGGGGGGGNPTGGKIDKVGKVGEVNLGEEDRKMLIDIAEQKYVNKVNLKTLSPKTIINVENNSGTPVDESKLAGQIKTVIDDELAAHSDGVYDY